MTTPQKTRFEGVYKLGKQLLTKNSTPGFSVYGEELINADGVEYRAWNPNRSKLAAAILKDLKNFPFKKASHILYLGASTGTTASHVADIADAGTVYCVEFSENSMRKLMKVCGKKGNMAPILGDARSPEDYSMLVGDIDSIYQDVAQPDQGDILIRNAGEFLKPGDWALIAVKARSIDVVAEPKDIFENERKKLEGVFEIVESVDLRPYHKDHILFVCRLV